MEQHQITIFISQTPYTHQLSPSYQRQNYYLVPSPSPRLLFCSRTVKKGNGKLLHPELMAHNIRLSKKVINIHDDNFTINVELFRQTFTSVELLRCVNTFPTSNFCNMSGENFVCRTSSISLECFKIDLNGAEPTTYCFTVQCSTNEGTCKTFL